MCARRTRELTDRCARGVARAVKDGFSSCWFNLYSQVSLPADFCAGCVPQYGAPHGHTLLAKRRPKPFARCASALGSMFLLPRTFLHPAFRGPSAMRPSPGPNTAGRRLRGSACREAAADGWACDMASLSEDVTELGGGRTGSEGCNGGGTEGRGHGTSLAAGEEADGSIPSVK